MNCFHLSILPVCVHMSFSVGAAGTAPRCALHSDMKQIFHYFQRAKEMIFLKNGQQNLQQCQYRPTAQLGQLTGENGFEFFPHRKLLMGQSTRDLEKRRYKTLKIWGAYACKVGPEIPLETDSARSLQYFHAAPLFRTEGPWKNPLTLLFQDLTQWTRFGRRWKLNFFPKLEGRFGSFSFGLGQQGGWHK